MPIRHRPVTWETTVTAPRHRNSSPAPLRRGPIAGGGVLPRRAVLGAATLGVAALAVPLGTRPSAAADRPAPSWRTRPAPSWRTRPTRSNTGVPDGWTPSRTIDGTNGKLTLTTDGATYTDVLFRCAVDVRAADVTFRRCRFAGGAPTGSYIGLLRFTDARSKRALVEDCTVEPAQPSPQWNGITGHDFTARRVQLRSVVDCFEVFNTADPDGPATVLIEGCWGGDFHFVSAASRPTGLPGWPSDRRTHNDWCQIQGGSNIHLHYNSMESFAGPTSDDALHVLPAGRQVLSNLMIKPDVGSIAGLNIHDNWCSGGDFAFNLADRTSSPVRPLSPRGRSLGRIQHNQFASGSQAYLHRGISMPPDASVDTGESAAVPNVWMGTRKAIRIYHNG